jgi:type VI secretion system secreted protein Hcp
MPVYLRYGKIKGEVEKPAYRGWIELLSFQWGVGRGISSPSGTASSREASSPSVSEITVTRRFDSVSALLGNEAFQGEGVLAIVDFVKDGHAYLRYTLTNTMISSYQVSGQGGKPTESLTLSFTKVEFKQTPGGPPPPP